MGCLRAVIPANVDACTFFIALTWPLTVCLWQHLEQHEHICQPNGVAALAAMAVACVHESMASGRPIPMLPF